MSTSRLSWLDLRPRLHQTHPWLDFRATSWWEGRRGKREKKGGNWKGVGHHNVWDASLPMKVGVK